MRSECILMPQTLLPNIEAVGERQINTLKQLIAFRPYKGSGEGRRMGDLSHNFCMGMGHSYQPSLLHGNWMCQCKHGVQPSPVVLFLITGWWWYIPQILGGNWSPNTLIDDIFEWRIARRNWEAATFDLWGRSTVVLWLWHWTWLQPGRWGFNVNIMAFLLGWEKVCIQFREQGRISWEPAFSWYFWVVRGFEPLHALLGLQRASWAGHSQSSGRAIWLQ